AQAAYARFVQEVFNPWLAAGERLAARLLAADWEPGPEHRQMLRRLRAESGLSHGRTADVRAAIAGLENEYFSLISGLSVDLDGAALTLPQAERELSSPDRDRRQAAWAAIQAAWRPHRERIDDLFCRLLGLRRQLAAQAGLPGYRAYRWREMGRLDYQPADCLDLHASVAAEVTPLAGAWLRRRQSALGLASLRPWDLKADPEPQPPVLAVAELAAGVGRMLGGLDPALGALFARMGDGFLDLESRPGKMPGGEEWLFPLSGMPYIHMNAVGSADDALTLFHECGHAFHDAMSAAQPLFWNLGAPSEFSEFAAMALVVLAQPRLERERGGLYAAGEAAGVRRRYLETIVTHWLPSICMLDAFQHWAYVEAPADVCGADLAAAWRALGERFLPAIDWAGLEAERGWGWQEQRLIVGAPFYSIEYVLAHLGALELAGRAAIDPAGAMAAYRDALALGGTADLAALFAAAGVRLPFDREAVRAAMAALDH
ncbi:MAG TPA: M3 family metallopeptidase, partial [Herpetosiphonaceae bacterium]|nr:M3 family metallopeptidase [Herpetosiphonaceae bacterium]